ncbi:MAG TPA: tRNA (adenosine(37)-N6)-dimethylallyltransferase MiaA [Smithellaceae bacterium]|mgnify:FL=1|nr:tRNA (adenosine(37)-N6)-dimethylallyltransferase MiaA [Smithellaceae bacterium]
MKSNGSSNANSRKRIPLVVIGSPTATGKTRLAIELAKTFGGEILGADSLQVYRCLDIGTAKPTLAQRREAVHHLIDVVNPDEPFNAAMYADLAGRVIADLNQAGKPIIVAGGTGLYIRALLRGIIETPPVDDHLRAYYKDLVRRYGKTHLHELLKERDPEAALRIHPNDAIRMIRALEVIEQAGTSIVELHRRHALAESPYRVCRIGLTLDRGELKDRIARRTRQMLEDGLLDEVRGLLRRGYAPSLKPLQSLGYRQAIAHLEGRLDQSALQEAISRETWRYAKRQMTWFGAAADTHWFHPDSVGEVLRVVREFLGPHQ